MKKIIYGGLVLSALLACHSTSYAQVGVNVDFINGQDVNFGGKMRSNTEASTYLYDTWSKGTVKLSDGNTYAGLELMYDLGANRLIFKSEKGIPQAFAVAVTEFTIAAPAEDKTQTVSKKYKNGFPPADGNKTTTFYEVLSNGNITLLKLTELKRVREVAVGNIYPTTQMKTADSYYVFADGKLSRIKREKKALKQILQDKAKDLDTYMASNKLDLKNDSDLSIIFDHYNAL
jgi:hypothetical protein